jgi:hypothetical protein
MAKIKTRSFREAMGSAESLTSALHVSHPPSSTILYPVPAAASLICVAGICGPDIAH